MTKRARRILSSLAAILTGATMPALAQQVTELTPNLVAMPAAELSVLHSETTGITRLVFAAISWNNGTGPMELVAGSAGPAGQDVYQRVYLSDGGFYDRLAGTFDYHAEHNHFHFEGYALYTLQPVNAPGASERQSSKTSFCLMDTTKVDTRLNGAPKQAVYTTCSAFIQGISVGWGDRYGPNLPGQSFDITNSPDGDYNLTIEYDPAKRLLEIDETDNTSCVQVRLNVSSRTVQVLGACSSPAVVAVASITPNSAYRGTSLNVTISGSGFAPGMAVGFENGSGGPAPTASQVEVVDANTITAIVTVKSGGPPREQVWDVRVGSAVLQRGFTVRP